MRKTLGTFAAIAIAAVVACALTGFPVFVEEVSATSSVGVAAIPAPTCPNRGWPYRECSGDGPAAIRLVTTDRLR
jgi:hypothetical protein